jgi:acyl carrier protein
MIGLRLRLRFEDMPTMSPPELSAERGSQAASVSREAIYQRLRRAMPHLSATLPSEATFADCGGDSLDFVELCCSIDSDYGVRLTVDDLRAAPKMGELLTLIDQRATRRPKEFSA